MDFTWKNESCVTRILLSLTLVSLGGSVLFTIFVPYCEHQLHLSITASYRLFSDWLSILYIASIFSGYIAQTYLTYYTAMLWGIILLILAESLLAVGHPVFFYSGLLVFPLGTTLFNTNVFAFFSKKFPKNNKTRTTIFIFLYLTMNIGAFLGGLCSQPIINYYGYNAFFIFSLILMIITFFIMIYRYPKDEKLVFYHHSLPIYVLSFISIGWLLLRNSATIHLITIIVYVTGIIYLWVRTRSHSKKDRQSALWFIVFSIFLVSYWSLYMLYPSVVEVFIEKTLTVKVFGRSIQPTAVASLSPFFLVILGLIIAQFKQHQENANVIKNKIASGLLFLAVGFIFLFIWKYIPYHRQLWLMIILIISYFFYALSEILTGPIMFSMVGLLVREELLGSMVGFTYLIHSFSGGITGWLASYSASKNHDPAIFLPYTTIALISAMIVILICYIKKPIQRL